MVRNTLLNLFIALLLAGCSNQPAPVSPVASHMLTLQTVKSTTATIPPQLIATATPIARFTQQCVPVNDKEVSWSEVVSGTMLVEQLSPSFAESVFVLKDVQNKNEYKLPVGSAYLTYSSFAISPNRKMIAQLQKDLDDKLNRIRNILWVLDAQGKVLSKTALDPTDLGELYWLDNERTLIDTEKYGTLLLVNPFTEEQRLIDDALPNPYQYFKTGVWWDVVYSPDFEWVAYYAEHGPVLYDLSKKQTIWESGPIYGSVAKSAVWSPDGQEVVVIGVDPIDGYQVYIINRSGQAKAVLGDGVPHDARSFSWSPNGDYIAIWNDDRLMVYDRQMDRVFDTCIQGMYGGGGYLAPYWSPDGKKIMVYGYSNPQILLLIDWQKKVAYKLKEDMPNHEIVYGWIN